MEPPDSGKQIGPKQPVRVTIFNQSYVVSSPGEPLAMEELARTVDELMCSIARRAGNLDSTRTAVLACLHLADRLRESEGELASLRESVCQKSRDLSGLLEIVFTAAPED